jgi:PAS domain S-box-containing protein
VTSGIKPVSGEPEQAVCPFTGWPIIRRPEWVEVHLDDNYWSTIEVIGGHILRSRPGGYATSAGVAKLNRLHHEAIAVAIEPGAPHVHIADYTDAKGATLDSRRAFSDDIKGRVGLAALIVHNAPPFFKLSIKLGRRLLGIEIPIKITDDYASAIRLALDILHDAGVEDIPTTSITGSATIGPGSETGGLEIDSLGLQYETIDGHILHAIPSGYIGLREMERAIDFENLAISSMDLSKGPRVIIAEMGGVKGVSAAARRMYVATMRNRQRTRPISLYVCYGVSASLRHAINISRPFLPFRLRFTRDRETALEIARRESGEFKPGPIHRLREVFTKEKRNQSELPPPDIDDLLRLIAGVDWENDGPVDASLNLAPGHPLTPVADALELIKADVDELFRTRHRTETALRQSEERYRTILDTIVDGYYEINLRGQVMFCNDALLRIFGFARSEIDELDTLALLASENQELAVSVFTQVYETGEPAHSIDWEISTRDGTPILIEMSISRITDVDGQPLGFRGIVRDITERINTAQENANLEAQLQRSQRMEAIGTLAGGIAHNFNNLLMGIQGNISLLMREHSPDSPHAKRLTTMEALVDGGSKLTSQLLGYARSGRVDVRIVDLNTLVLEIAETFSLTRKEYRVHIELAPSTMPAEVDAAQIEQAILNLLINAADAMPRGGDLYLSSRVAHHTELTDPEHEIKKGNHAVLSIRDTGIGMDRETLERCFEPFFTTKGISGGTGLGLASAYGIVRANGGFIDVVSEVGRGTTFSLSFPMAGNGPDSTLATRGEPIAGVGTILIVEDDEAVLEACSEMLTHLQYTPICVTSGAAAIDIFTRRQDEIDLVILDLILTDLNGGEVFDRLRSIDPTARVLLASGYSLDGEAAGILDRGCDDFIQKPFTIEQLSRKLERLLRANS